MSKLGNVRIRKNSGAIVGTRRLLNFIEGANITLTIVDDGPGDEVDITIVAGAATVAWVDQFFPAPDPNMQKGTYAAVLMEDDYDIDVWQTFMVPSDIVTIDSAVVIIISEGVGNIRWECATNFAEVCVNEDFQIHTDSIGATITGVSTDEVECLDITGALTGAAGGDLVGLHFTRTGSNAGDTVNADVYYVGVLIRGSV